MLIKQERENFRALSWLDEFMTGHKGFICGGCFKNIFNNEKVKDLDMFFENRTDWNEAIQHFDSLTAGYTEDGVEEVSEEDAQYGFLYENDNVKAYIHKKTGVRIELCNKIFGTAEQIISQFDFTITKFAYYKVKIEDETGTEVEKIPFGVEAAGEKLKTHIEYRVIYDDKYFEHLCLKRLVINDKIPYPVNTFERMFRYAKYGYFPCKETKMNIIQALRELSDKEVQLSENLYDGMD